MILVGATCAAYKCDGNGDLTWLRNAEALAAASPEPVQF